VPLVIILHKQEQPDTVELVLVIIALFQALLNFKYLQQELQLLTKATQTSLNTIANTAIQHKLSRYVDTSMSLAESGIYGIGVLMTVTDLAAEFRPYYEVKAGTGGQYMLWYDFAVLQLNHSFESTDHIINDLI